MIEIPSSMNGYKIQIQVLSNQSNSPVDLSPHAASTKKAIFNNASAGEVEFPCEFVSDGQDGNISFVVSEPLNPGLWSFRVALEGVTSLFTFRQVIRIRH